MTSSKHISTTAHLKNVLLNMSLRSESYQVLESLSAFLHAGTDIFSALRAIVDETRSKRLKRFISQIADDIESGASFSKALEQTELFPSYIIAIIALGERSGRLVENIQIVLIQHEKEVVFRSRVRSALMYSVVVLTLTIIVGAGTAWFVLPQLAEIFSSLDAELPLITRVIIAGGEFLGTYGSIIIPFSLLVIAGIFYFLFSFPRTKFIGHSILFRVPVIKNLIKYVEVAQFGFLLGTMLEAGLTIIESVEGMRQISAFKNYQAFYAGLYTELEEGKSLHDGMVAKDPDNILFPAITKQMVFAAERSGTLSQTLVRLGEMFEAKTDKTAKDLPIIIEPILLIIVAGAVTILALGTLLPIYGLFDSL